MSQSCVFVTPAFGHSTTQCAPFSQVVWHGPAEHAKSQVLPAPQVQEPLAHVPLQLAF
jgi:hypothetical protein